MNAVSSATCKPIAPIIIGHAPTWHLRRIVPNREKCNHPTQAGSSQSARLVVSITVMSAALREHSYRFPTGPHELSDLQSTRPLFVIPHVPALFGRNR